MRAIDTASALTLPPNAVSGTDLVLLAGIAAVLAAWGWSRSEPRPAGWETAREGQAQDARTGA